MSRYDNVALEASHACKRSKGRNLGLPFLPVLIASDRVGAHTLREDSYDSQTFSTLTSDAIDHVCSRSVCNGDGRDPGCV